METLKHDFYVALSNRNKEMCTELVRKALTLNQVSIPELYEGILTPALFDIASYEKAQSISIWEEHVQSGIVRTCLELCYPYVTDQKKTNGQRAMVFCQEEEYHELGARMTTDFLTLLGFETTFIGANTPPEEALLAAKALSPDLIAISVTNYFHLTKVNTLIERLRELPNKSDLKILVGGYAIAHTPKAKEAIKADFFASTFSDLEAIKEALHETRL